MCFCSNTNTTAILFSRFLNEHANIKVKWGENVLCVNIKTQLVRDNEILEQTVSLLLVH